MNLKKQRIRENLVKKDKESFKDLLNFSINATLSRTIMTSVTTLIALLALLILGGDVIAGFVSSMIWGVFIGTYSSIFIVVRVLMMTDLSKKDMEKPKNEPEESYSLD